MLIAKMSYCLTLSYTIFLEFMRLHLASVVRFRVKWKGDYGVPVAVSSGQWRWGCRPLLQSHGLLCVEACKLAMETWLKKLLDCLHQCAIHRCKSTYQFVNHFVFLHVKINISYFMKPNAQRSGDLKKHTTKNNQEKHKKNETNNNKFAIICCKSLDSTETEGWVWI